MKTSFFLSRQTLIASAKQNQINGKPNGQWNQQSGFGLIDAVQAAHRLRPQMPFATIQTFENKQLVTGPSTITRVPLGSFSTWSAIWSTVWRRTSRPHTGQWGCPTRA